MRWLVRVLALPGASACSCIMYGFDAPSCVGDCLALDAQGDARADGTWIVSYGEQGDVGYGVENPGLTWVARLEVAGDPDVAAYVRFDPPTLVSSPQGRVPEGGMLVQRLPVAVVVDAPAGWRPEGPRLDLSAGWQPDGMATMQRTTFAHARFTWAPAADLADGTTPATPGPALLATALGILAAARRRRSK